jgi:hypothetical protein
MRSFDFIFRSGETIHVHCTSAAWLRKNPDARVHAAGRNDAPFGHARMAHQGFTRFDLPGKQLRFRLAAAAGLAHRRKQMLGIPSRWPAGLRPTRPFMSCVSCTAG